MTTPVPATAGPTAPADWWGDGTTVSAGDGAAGAAARGNSPLAVWALVSGIAGFLLCGVVLGPLAVVLGYLARQRARAEGNPSEGLALAAMLIGTIAFVLNIVVIALLLANPDLLDTTPT